MAFLELMSKTWDHITQEELPFRIRLAMIYLPVLLLMVNVSTQKEWRPIQHLPWNNVDPSHWLWYEGLDIDGWWMYQGGRVSHSASGNNLLTPTCAPANADQPYPLPARIQLYAWNKQKISPWYQMIREVNEFQSFWDGLLSNAQRHFWTLMISLTPHHTDSLLRVSIKRVLFENDKNPSFAASKPSKPLQLL